MVSLRIGALFFVSRVDRMDEDHKRIVKFNSHRVEDHGLWSMRMEALFESKELLEDVLRDTDRELTSGELTGPVKLKMGKNRALLLQGLVDKPLRTVVGEQDPATMYLKLNERYVTKCAAT